MAAKKKSHQIGGNKPTMQPDNEQRKPQTAGPAADTADIDREALDVILRAVEKAGYRPGEDIVLFEYTKKNNRETGPALVGIEIQDRARIGDLLTRMEASPLHIEKLEPDSPVFSFLL